MNRARAAIFAASLQVLGCVSQDKGPNGLGNLKILVSPDGRYAAMATLGSSGGGATGSSISWVHLGRKSAGKPAEDVEEVFEGLHACNLRLEWKNEALLAIHYSGAECNIHDFRNYWYDPESIKVQRPVRVEIVLERD